MNYYQQHQSDFLEGLKAFLRIPSISTLSENKPDIRRAAEFALNELRAAGMTAAELIEGEGNPLVYARMAGCAGQAHHPLLRPLRRAAARPARRVEVAALRAGDPRQRHFRARRLRRQRPGLHPDQGRGGPAEDHRQAAGQREVPARRRRRDRRRAHRGVRQDQAAAPEGRCGGGVRHRDVRARAAHHLRGAARHGVLRAARRGRQPRSAFGRVRRRRAQPDAGHRRDHLRAQGPRRPHP